MNIKPCVVLLLAFSGAIHAGIDADKLIVSFAHDGAHLYAANEGYTQSLPNEKNFRQRLYWLDKNNPHYFLLDSFKNDIEYYIAVLTDHIAVLENKISQPKNRFKSVAMVRGVGCSAFSALSGAGAYFSYITRNDSVYWPARSNAVNSSMWFGITAAMCAVAAGAKFYKVACYAERLVERLARDRRILDVLQREKAAKEVLKA